jgi:hypothetical protein
MLSPNINGFLIIRLILEILPSFLPIFHYHQYFFSKISTFFRENDDDKAIRTIMDVAKNLKLSATTLDLESRWNCNYTRLQVFELLLLFPFFIVKNAFQYTDSTLAKVVPCKKDVFYRFLEKGAIDWCNLGYRINKQLLRKINLRDDSLNSKDPVCLIIDDSDLPKTGTKIEKMGRIYWIQRPLSLSYRWQDADGS